MRQFGGNLKHFIFWSTSLHQNDRKNSRFDFIVLNVYSERRKPTAWCIRAFLPSLSTVVNPLHMIEINLENVHMTNIFSLSES